MTHRRPRSSTNKVSGMRVAVVEAEIEQLPAEQLDAERHELFDRRL